MYTRSAVGLAIVVALVATGCGDDKADTTASKMPVTIEATYHQAPDSEQAATKRLVSDFNQSHKDVQVDLKVVPEADYNQYLQDQGSAGTLTCLVDINGPFLTAYASQGFLRPLDSDISPALRDDFVPETSIQGKSTDGKMYGVPILDSGMALWGNKSLLQKAGVRIPVSAADAWTAPEFMDALAKLKATPGVEYPLDLQYNVTADDFYTYVFSPVFQSFGGDVINRSTQKAIGTLDGAQSVAAMNWFQGLFQKNYATATPVRTDDFDGSHKSALSWTGSWNWDAFHKALGDDLVLIPMPAVGSTRVATHGSWLWGVSSTCPNPDQAWTFLDYALQSNNVLTFSESSGVIPSLKSATAKSTLYGANGPLAIYAQQLSDGSARARPATPKYSALSTNVGQALQAIGKGAPVEATLKDAAKKIDDAPPLGQK